MQIRTLFRPTALLLPFVLGGAVNAADRLFPVLDRYPEAPERRSLADQDPFVVTQLDEDP